MATTSIQVDFQPLSLSPSKPSAFSFSFYVLLVLWVWILPIIPLRLRRWLQNLAKHIRMQMKLQRLRWSFCLMRIRFPSCRMKIDWLCRGWMWALSPKNPWVADRWIFIELEIKTESGKSDNFVRASLLLINSAIFSIWCVNFCN